MNWYKNLLKISTYKHPDDPHPASFRHPSSFKNTFTYRCNHCGKEGFYYKVKPRCSGCGSLSLEPVTQAGKDRIGLGQNAHLEQKRRMIREQRPKLFQNKGDISKKQYYVPDPEDTAWLWLPD